LGIIFSSMHCFFRCRWHTSGSFCLSVGDQNFKGLGVPGEGKPRIVNLYQKAALLTTCQPLPSQGWSNLLWK
jgi:hypothetical protein